MPPKSDLNKAGVESSDFPVLCETCLGSNPYVRMSKQPLGSECKICTRPFTLFRWLPGAGMRYKKTEICQTCAKGKNVCQTCLLDLQFGLPTQVRDSALGNTSTAPTSAINREYYAQNMEGRLEDGSASGAVSYGKADSAGKDLLKRLARSDPGYKRNRPHLCSFFAKGSCARGDECPYRHELAVENGLGQQNIKDRYHGVNDPVAAKIMATHAASNGLAPPLDTTITSLFLTSLAPEVTEDKIKALYPTAKSVVMVETSRVAFVNFSTREAAETGSALLSPSIDGVPVKVSWGRSRKPKAVTAK